METLGSKVSLYKYNRFVSYIQVRVIYKRLPPSFFYSSHVFLNFRIPHLYLKDWFINTHKQFRYGQLQDSTPLFTGKPRTPRLYCVRYYEHLPDFLLLTPTLDNLLQRVNYC